MSISLAARCVCPPSTDSCDRPNKKQAPPSRFTHFHFLVVDIEPLPWYLLHSLSAFILFYLSILFLTLKRGAHLRKRLSIVLKLVLSGTLTMFSVVTCFAPLSSEDFVRIYAEKDLKAPGLKASSGMEDFPA